jgi:hypothetical protein
MSLFPCCEKKSPVTRCTSLSSVLTLATSAARMLSGSTLSPAVIFKKKTHATECVVPASAAKYTILKNGKLLSEQNRQWLVLPEVEIKNANHKTT